MRHFGDVARRLWGARSWPNSLQHNSDSDGRRDDFEGFLKAREVELIRLIEPKTGLAVVV